MQKTLLLAGIAGLFTLNANTQYCNCQQKSQPLYNTQSTYQSQKSLNYNNQSQTSFWNIRPVVGADFVYSVLNFSNDNELIKDYAEDEYKAFSLSLGAKFNPYTAGLRFYFK